MSKADEFTLKRDLKSVSRELANLNRELASQTILLASQTGDTAPLIDAVTALRKAEGLYSLDTNPHEQIDVQQALADTLLSLGRAKDDVEALEASIEAYRGAITLASMMGDERKRKALKKNYARARNLLGSRGSVRGAA